MTSFKGGHSGNAGAPHVRGTAASENITCVTEWYLETIDLRLARNDDDGCFEPSDGVGGIAGQRGCRAQGSVSRELASVFYVKSHNGRSCIGRLYRCQKRKD